MSTGIVKATTVVVGPTSKVIGSGALTAATVVGDGAGIYSSAQPTTGSGNDSKDDALISGILAKNLGLAEFSLLKMDASARGAQRAAGLKPIGSPWAIAAIAALSVLHAVIGYNVLNRGKSSTSSTGHKPPPAKSPSRKRSRSDSRTKAPRSIEREQIGRDPFGGRDAAGGGGSGAGTGSSEVMIFEPILVEGHVNAGPGHTCDTVE